MIHEASVYNFDLNVKMEKAFCIPGMLQDLSLSV
jgi:hypothetical protein